MLVSLISGFKASVQTELNAFFAHLANQSDLTREASAQAFSKARKQFSHLAFAYLNQRFISLVSSHLNIPHWNGLRVVVADASKMRMYLQDVCNGLINQDTSKDRFIMSLEVKYEQSNQTKKT